ncbi:MAG: 5-(carboxyamino)imidazole ribonucleotide mutase [Gammaproteobacteria bacterium]|nr:5-(carboxyamino)imidazole ribonucleotide mutase [Gammaproteobacteria bacterium]NIM75012.1 5-(carboxyamino)imidazole ribonucleotide mutase [Gammaproteobacteria bacterium]NIN40062.1 5-(carboxyamino)imidazole ribonucleotide mutase [Gammaproteobacteria bacterium]NIO26549.1 5-(carboxyamino)imidazole ribonucleotide mutase [Gammaproteobacteria bacterium]NIO67101.1 5-(carboxyamino)imidazole ribonucleotide mutase [Gammaproteobacteria bacterium]
MGSDSDLATMQGCIDVLDKLGIAREVRITSAHRTPEATREYVLDAERRGCAVFIAAAGMAAHLAGAVAAQTLRPVIGVPIDAGPLKGLDALLSTVQMPAGVPVASVAIGSAGAKNAAFLAAQVLGVADSDVHSRVRAERAASAEGVAAKDRAVQQKLESG